MSPIAGAVGEAQRGGGVGCKLLVAVGNRVENDFIRQVEDARGRGEAERMSLAHEAGADEPDAQGRLVTGHRHVVR